MIRSPPHLATSDCDSRGSQGYEASPGMRTTSACHPIPLPQTHSSNDPCIRYFPSSTRNLGRTYRPGSIACSRKETLQGFRALLKDPPRFPCPRVPGCSNILVRGEPILSPPLRFQSGAFLEWCESSRNTRDRGGKCGSLTAVLTHSKPSAWERVGPHPCLLDMGG